MAPGEGAARGCGGSDVELCRPGPRRGFAPGPVRHTAPRFRARPRSVAEPQTPSKTRRRPQPSNSSGGRMPRKPRRGLRPSPAECPDPPRAWGARPGAQACSCRQVPSRLSLPPAPSLPSSHQPHSPFCPGPGPQRLGDPRSSGVVRRTLEVTQRISARPRAAAEPSPDPLEWDSHSQVAWQQHTGTRRGAGSGLLSCLWCERNTSSPTRHVARLVHQLWAVALTQDRHTGKLAIRLARSSVRGTK